MFTEPNQSNTEQKPVPHYYGDTIRKYLLIAGLLLLLAVIFDKELFKFYLIMGGVGVLVFTVLAGLTSPRTKPVIINIAAISAAMFLVFEYFTISGYLQSGIFNVPFLIREALAIIFLVILYYSTKTIRGMSLSEKSHFNGR